MRSLDLYARIRTAGQPVQLYIGVEKDTLRLQVMAWVAALGLPVIVRCGAIPRVLRQGGQSSHCP